MEPLGPSSFSSPTPTPSTTTLVAPSPELNTREAAERFRSKVLSVPESKLVIRSIEPGEVKGVVRVYVNNLWFDSRIHQRRQITQMLANLWQQEVGPDNKGIMHIYDIAGREIAGTRIFGGVWVEDE
jgi:hypothetical protein